MSDEPKWMRQPGLACEYCGKPGFYFVVPPPVTAYALADDGSPPAVFEMERHVTCPEDRRLIEAKLRRERDPDRFAMEHGRPIGWGETGPERFRSALRSVADAIEQDDPLRAARFRAVANQ